jgi:hypothetical protein
MQRLEVGKLYSCSKYFLMLYPDKDTASTALASTALASTAERDLRYAATDAAYWTRELGKPVSYCNPLTPLLVLSVKEQYIQVLAGDKKGWIINMDWLNIQEIVDEAA